MKGKVPEEIEEYWKDRNMWGQYRAFMRTVKGIEIEQSQVVNYKFLSNQGHLSPRYQDVLSYGLQTLYDNITERINNENEPKKLEFLKAAQISLLGVKEWAERYSNFLKNQSDKTTDLERKNELLEMSRICGKIATDPPSTFYEAMQLIWLIHQAIHIEGHGYSCTPDRIDQILYPFYKKDIENGIITEDDVLELCTNFILKMRDNTFWGIEHNLTQGLVVGGSTRAGEDQTNELSHLFIKGSGILSLPEPLIWIRWHPNMDKDFVDLCLQNIAQTTCFPLIMSDTAVPYMLMELGVLKEDAFNYVPVGCNEIGIPGQLYFNPGAHVNYLDALEATLTDGKGYDGNSTFYHHKNDSRKLETFEELIRVFGDNIRQQIQMSYQQELDILHTQIQRGVTPLTSCFFDGCIENGHDLAEGTKYNILSCGGISFANIVDSLSAIREVVYEKKEASVEDIVEACRLNFKGYESLRKKLLNAPKHGNDDSRIDDIISTVENLRDKPLKEICHDPRDGSPFGNCHVVRSSAVRVGNITSATPDGRLAGTPLAGSVAASSGVEKNGPTALLNSVLKLDPVKSWQSGYNVNIRLQKSLMTNSEDRAKIQLLVENFLEQGGQELQINTVDSKVLNEAKKHPEEHKDLVVRVAGFSEYFINLTEDIQDEIIARTEHSI